MTSPLREHPRDGLPIAMHNGRALPPLKLPPSPAHAKAEVRVTPERTPASNPPTCSNATRRTAAFAVCANAKSSSASVISWLIEDFSQAYRAALVL